MAFVRKSREEPRYNEDGRGRFKVTYETPNNNIGNDRFETKSEAARFADSLRKRGYKNVTIGESRIDEAVAQQDRYIRTHGKSAKGLANESHTHLEPDSSNSVSLTNPEFFQKVRNEMNQISGSYITPYIALHKVRKQLARYNIFMTDQLIRLPDDQGEYYFQIYQMGTLKTYQSDDGQFLDQDDIGPEMYIYLNIFRDSNFGGFYMVDIVLMDSEELSSIIGDDEIEDF